MAKVNTTALVNSLSGFLNALPKEIQRRVFDVYKEKLLTKILSNIMSVYDSEVAVREPNYDPARPSKYREDFQSAIQSELNTSLSIEGINNVFMSLDIRDLLHTDKAGDELYIKEVPKRPSVFDWLIFYLEGFIGEYAFITRETYAKFAKAGRGRKNGLAKFSSWGWYGEGFMIPRKTYIKQGLNTVVPFDQVRHPLSGVRPVNLFSRILEGIDFKELLTEAVVRAIKG